VNGILLLFLLSRGETIEEIRKAFSEGRHEDVVALADRAPAEPSDPLRGEILFWKGTSLARLGRHEEAVAAIDEARALGFTPSELYLERAFALRTLGQEEEAERSFQEAERLAQEDPERLAELRRRWREAARRFELRLVPHLGYDSNLFYIDEATPLLANVDRDSVYYGILLSARHLLIESREVRVYLDYQNNLRSYVDEPDFSFTDNLLSASLRTGVFDGGLYYGETWLADEGHFRTQLGGTSALVLGPADPWGIRVWGEVRYVDYHSAVPSPQDRDGTILRLGIVPEVMVGGWKIGLIVGYSDWDTDGTDYLRTEWEAGVAVTSPEFVGLRWDVASSYVWADFDRPHSLTSFKQVREDERLQIRLTVAFLSLGRSLGTEPSLHVTYERWNSNLNAFDFDRWDLSSSVDILALSF